MYLQNLSTLLHSISNVYCHGLKMETCLLVSKKRIKKKMAFSWVYITRTWLSCSVQSKIACTHTFLYATYSFVSILKLEYTHYILLEVYKRIYSFQIIHTLLLALRPLNQINFIYMGSNY